MRVCTTEFAGVKKIRTRVVAREAGKITCDAVEWVGEIVAPVIITGSCDVDHSHLYVSSITEEK